MSMTWEEACTCKWEGPKTGHIYLFKIEEGYIFYSSDGGAVWERWVRENTTSPNQNLLDFGYKILGFSDHYKPPSPQEKVCKKIAVMEARWKAFQERKHHV